jgi:beta-lactamase regulating signal transducer with metallopeptidase domain
MLAERPESPPLFDSIASAVIDDVPIAPAAASNDRTVWLWLWLAGAIAYWVMVLLAVIRLQRRVRGSTRTDCQAADLAQRVAARLGLRRFPRVEFADLPVSPMVFAASWRPRLIMPRDLWDRMSEPQRETMLAHEFAHVARRDHWVRCLEVFVLGCYWWCPIAWFARTRLQRAEEACCDRRVLQAYPQFARAYAEALIETAMFVARPSCVPLASGGSATANELKRRVAMILSNRPNYHLRRPFTALMLAIGVALLTLRPGFSQPAPTPSSDPVTTAQPTQPAPSSNQPNTKTTTADALIDNNTVGLYQAWQAGLSGPSANKTQANRWRDEVETLEAQRNTKKAQLQVAKAVAAAAERRCELIRGTNSSKMELLQADEDRTIAQAKVLVQDAELQEHDIKIKQAQRHLDDATTATKNQRGPDLRGMANYEILKNYSPEHLVIGTKVPATDPTKANPYEKLSLDSLQDQLQKLAIDQQQLQSQLKKAQDEYNALNNRYKALQDHRISLEDTLKQYRIKLQEKPPEPKE